jgi:hypothetical protein
LEGEKKANKQIAKAMFQGIVLPNAYINAK